ncbi:hypothetical protein ACVNF4_16410 [Streptomyces sp. S6]
MRIVYPRVNGEAAGLEVVEGVADRFGGVFARQLLADCLWVLRSPLEGRAVTALWQAATFRDFDLERLGVDGREWVGAIAEVAERRILRDDPCFRPAALAPSVDEEVRARVLAEVESLADVLDEEVGRHAYNPVGGVVPALRTVVTEADPGLGHRLLLRVLKAYFVRIGPARYERYLTLGDDLGLGEGVVDDGDFNVWDDVAG